MSLPWASGICPLVVLISKTGDSATRAISSRICLSSIGIGFSVIGSDQCNSLMKRLAKSKLRRPRYICSMFRDNDRLLAFQACSQMWFQVYSFQQYPVNIFPPGLATLGSWTWNHHLKSLKRKVTRRRSRRRHRAHLRIERKWVRYQPTFSDCKHFINRFCVCLVLRIHNALFSLRKLRNVGDIKEAMERSWVPEDAEWEGARDQC